MFRPQFNTPYLLSADGYKEHFDVLDPHFEVKPVYMVERKGSECAVAVYNFDMTEEEDRIAWISILELSPYSLDAADEIEEELQEYIDECEDAIAEMAESEETE